MPITMSDVATYHKATWNSLPNFLPDPEDAAYPAYRVLDLETVLRPVRTNTDCSVHQTTSSPLKFKRGFRYEVDLQGRVIQP
jgi:hypothetical protein